MQKSVYTPNNPDLESSILKSFPFKTIFKIKIDPFLKDFYKLQKSVYTLKNPDCLGCILTLFFIETIFKIKVDPFSKYFSKYVSKYTPSTIRIFNAS